MDEDDSLIGSGEYLEFLKNLCFFLTESIKERRANVVSAFFKLEASQLAGDADAERDDREYLDECIRLFDLLKHEKKRLQALIDIYPERAERYKQAIDDLISADDPLDD